jgi:transcriptional antiterminator RfaH
VTERNQSERESETESAIGCAAVEARHSSAILPGEASESDKSELAWYCVKTKPKHDHIAAANLRRNLGLQVFNPTLRFERTTRSGIRRVTEPLFPGYVFVRCELGRSFDEVQHANGVAALVHFGNRVPRIADSVIEELQKLFPTTEPLPVEDRILPGEEVAVGEGPFSGAKAVVLRVLPARQRVEILLEVLGRPAPLELDWNSVVRENRNAVGRLAPFLVREQQESAVCA